MKLIASFFALAALTLVGVGSAFAQEESPSPEEKAHLKAQRWNMWRYDAWLPLGQGERPVTLGEGGTPLLRVERIAAPPFPAPPAPEPVPEVPA